MLVCFLDNDIILKLAAYDLFAEVIAAFDLTWQDLRILNTAIYIIRAKNTAKHYSPECIQRAISIVEKCQTVPTQPTDEFQLLLRIDEIDEGEASLIAATATESAFWLMTGDKRCLKALVSDESIASIRQRLVGRTICLEQILLKLISIHGIDWVQHRVLDAPICDKAIKIAFGWSTPADETSVKEALNSYIKELEKQSQGLLANLT